MGTAEVRELRETRRENERYKLEIEDLNVAEEGNKFYVRVKSRKNGGK